MAANQYPRVPTAPPTEATTRIQLPWAEAQLAEGSVDASNDGTPEPIDDDPIVVYAPSSYRCVTVS